MPLKKITVIDTPQIVQSSNQLAAVIHLMIPRSEIGRVMGPAMGELMATLSAQGVAPAGPVFSHHLRMDPSTFNFEVGVPVAGPIKAVGRVKLGLLLGTTVARTIYRGPYQGLGPAWGEFMKWIVDNGHTPAIDLWESYVVGPESNPDPSKWETEFNRPLIFEVPGQQQS